MLNLNLVEILKNVPKGTKLYSPLCGECAFYKIESSESGNKFVDLICVYDKYEEDYYFYSDGTFTNNEEVECLLFPSKENRDWSTFKFEHSFKDGDPVWVRDDENFDWNFRYFRDISNDNERPYLTYQKASSKLVIVGWRYCKPFTGWDPYK